MLKKKDATQETIIVFDRDPLVSILPIGKEIVSFIPAWDDRVVLTDQCNGDIRIIRGTVARVISVPKRKNYAIMVGLELQESGKSVYCFWTDVYHNASKLIGG